MFLGLLETLFYVLNGWKKGIFLYWNSIRRNVSWSFMNDPTYFLHGRFYVISSVLDEVVQERKCSFKLEDWDPDFHPSSYIIVAHAQS